MRVLICGDRHWTDFVRLCEVMDSFAEQNPVDCVIEGDAKGADRLGGVWAKMRTISVAVYPAEWELYGRGAGPIRNQQMLTEGRPDVVFAFHNDLSSSKWTAHMIKIALKAGLSVHHVSSLEVKPLCD